MSRALFDAIPVGPELSVPKVPGAGTPAASRAPRARWERCSPLRRSVGRSSIRWCCPTVCRRCPPWLPRSCRTRATRVAAAPAVVSPAALAKLPVVNGLDLSAYPDSPLKVTDIRDNPSTCWWWAKTSGEERARVQVISGPTVPIAS